MFCPMCGNRLEKGWRACPNCSHPIQSPPAPDPFPPPVTDDIGMVPDAMNRGPSRWFYGIGAVLIVIPCIAAVAILLVEMFTGFPDTRFLAPGSQELRFDDTGKHILFYEYQSTIDGTRYLTGESLKPITVRIRSQDGARTVPVESSSWDLSYDLGNRAGRALFEFNIKEPGTYILSAQYQDGTSRPDVVLAVGPDWNLAGGMLRTFLISFAGLVAGVLLIVWVFLKRRKARQAMETMYPAVLAPGYASNKSRLVTSLLALFLGQLGVHRFYLEKIVTGILMLITAGGLGVWALIDFILALCGEMNDKEGRPLTNW